MDPSKFLIHGEWCHSDDKLDVFNPYNGEVIAVACRPSKADVEQAIASNVEAFESSRKMPSYKRAEILRNAAQLLDERKEDVARTLSLEAGKAIKHARGEVTRAVSTLTIAAEEALRIYGEAIPLDITPAAGDRLGITRRFPMGPIAGISPFNFPLNLVCHKVAPALATGNTISVKPASATPLSALKLGEILLEAGALPGLFNVLPCSASLADPLVTDPRFKMVTFTGSAEVGWDIKNRAGKKKVCLELGGNAAAVVDEDADVNFAVTRCVLGGYAYSGQVCISVQRIIIHHRIYDTFVENFVNEVQALKLGDPLAEDTDLGPMIDTNAAIEAEKWIREAESQGAEILTGGKRDGAMLQPTVIANAPRESKVSCEEVFAPVVVVQSYKTIEEAIQMVNDSDFGLQAGIFTRDIEKVFKAYNNIDAGGVIVNDIPTYRVDHMPYGGVKDSGFGREGLRYAMEEMTELKLMVVNHGLSF